MARDKFERKDPSAVIYQLFYDNNVWVKVDDEDAEIIKILSDSDFLVKTCSGKTFKVTSDNERVKYAFSERDLYEFELAITLPDSSINLHRALNRLLLAKDEEDVLDIHKLVEMYKCLVEQPIKIHRDIDSTKLELILECIPENLYDKASYNKQQLQLFELLSTTTITLSCFILYLPDTVDLDLQKYKYCVTIVKNKVLEEINRVPELAPCAITVFIDH